MLDKATRIAPAPTAPSFLSIPDELAARSQDSLVLLARFLLAAIFVPSGFGKLMALGTFTTQLAGQGVPMATLVAPVAASIEFFGGLAVVLGLATRYAALLLVVFTIAATMTSHRFWELADAARRGQQVHFFKNVAIMGGFVLLFVTGAGRLSFDRMLRRGGV
jgi:putative oxidoreductase